MFANVKNKIKLPKKKDKAVKVDKKADAKFYAEHIEEFRFIVKYFPVFQDVAIKVGEQKIAELDKEKPCQFRKKCDTPFRCKCAIKVDGTECKTIKQCKECVASKQE